MQIKPESFNAHAMHFKVPFPVTQTVVELEKPFTSTLMGDLGDFYSIDVLRVVGMGDDGSVMASCNISFSRKATDSRTDTLLQGTFLWSGVTEDYEKCEIVDKDGEHGWIDLPPGGAAPGFSRHIGRGFYTDRPSVGPPLTRALVVKQMGRHDGSAPVPFFVQTYHPASPTSQPDTPVASGQGDPTHNDYYPKLPTYRGRIWIPRSFLPVGVEWIGTPSSFVQVDTQGSTRPVELPSDLGEAWGLGNPEGLLRVHTSPDMQARDRTSGIVQLDERGIGIGDTTTMRGVWCNGSWHPLSTLTDSAAPADLIPAQITRNGIIRAQLGTSGLPSDAGILLPVEVVPDDDQPGKTGDQIPSNKGATGEKHYVSPKKSAEIDDEFVVLKAKGIEKELFEKVLEWEGGEAVPNEPLKRRVKRDATGKTVVKLKTKNGGQEVDLINVWIVWADTEVVQSSQGVEFSPGSGGYSGSGFGLVPEKAWQFKFKIKPVELFSQDPTADLPKLDGNATSKPPGDGTRYFFTEHLNFPDEFGDTAPLKWDVSRQLEIKVFNNPSGTQVPLAKFKDTSTFLKAGQPAAETTPIPYPADAAQGNDDPITRESRPIKDEDSDPYKAIAENKGLDHEIGEISSFDDPVFGPFVSEPELGSAMVQIANFREFARLEIKGGITNHQNPKNWYRVSDYIDWHHVWAAIYGEKPPDSGNFGWFDNGSSSGNNIFAPLNE